MICTKPLKREKNNWLKITRVRVIRVTLHSNSDNKMYKVLQIKKLKDRSSEFVFYIIAPVEDDNILE